MTSELRKIESGGTRNIEIGNRTDVVVDVNVGLEARFTFDRKVLQEFPDLRDDLTEYLRKAFDEVHADINKKFMFSPETDGIDFIYINPNGWTSKPKSKPKSKSKGKSKKFIDATGAFGLYECTKCKKEHQKKSKIGKSHKKFAK